VRASIRRRTIGALLAALAAACGREAPPPSAPPRLVFAATAHDAGPLPQGAPIEHAFTFRNDGGAPLTIIQLRPGPGCEAILAGGSDIAPGGAGTIRSRCETADWPGPQRRTVTVYSNDPQQRAAVLLLTGTVALEAAAEPARVYLGPVPRGAAALRRVALRSGNDGVRFTAANTTAAQLTVRVVDVDGGRALLLGTAATAAPGPFATVVRVHTTSPARPFVDVPVAGIIVAPDSVAADAAAETR
jgi:hypothetical protein